jgi:hypothetical protein
VACHASATNAGAAAGELLRPVPDPVLSSSHPAFEPPDERKIYDATTKNSVTTTLARPALSMPSMSTPFDRPVAPMMVFHVRFLRE